MSKKLQICYSGFWDFPLAFTVRWEGQLFLFFREFDDELDECEDHYRVYLLRQMTDEEVKASWLHIESRATHYLGKVAVKDVLFDPTHRREIDSDIFQTLVMPLEALGAMR